MVSVHAGAAGHRSLQVCFDHCTGVIYWPTLRADLDAFLRRCIHCMQNQSAHAKRPFGKQITPQWRNEIISFDYVHVGPSASGNTKLLVICDKLSNFTQLHPVRSENAEQAAHALLLWFGSFGVPKALLSDESPAFKNVVIAELVRLGSMDHHLVTARAHWANGRQERRNLDIGNMIRKWLSEYRLPMSQWEQLVPLLLGALNHTKTEGNLGRAPSWAFLGLDQPKPLDYFLDAEENWRHSPISEQEKYDLAADVARTGDHRSIYLHGMQEQSVYLSRLKQAAKPGVRPSSFELGDYVMALNEYAKAKHDARWHGPGQVTGIYEEGNVYGVRFLSHRTKKDNEQRIHAVHLRLFDHAEMVVTPELMLQAQYFANKKWDLERLMDVRLVRDQWQIKVMWTSGLDSWEIMEKLDEDVPGLD
jgi:hypothetical protein